MNRSEFSIEWVDLAVETLQKRGPMKIRALASAIGHPFPRSLSLLLRRSKGRVKQECNRWRATNSFTDTQRLEWLIEHTFLGRGGRVEIDAAIRKEKRT